MNQLKWYRNGLEVKAVEGEDGVTCIKLCDKFSNRAYIYRDTGEVMTVVCDEMLLLMTPDDTPVDLSLGS